MRVFLGIILGILLTVAGAYVIDSVNAGPPSASADASAPRKPMVNWDVVDNNWQAFTGTLSRGWHRLERMAESK